MLVRSQGVLEKGQMDVKKKLPTLVVRVDLEDKSLNSRNVLWDD